MTRVSTRLSHHGPVRSRPRCGASATAREYVATTSWPRARRTGTSRPPTYPPAPVTKTRMEPPSPSGGCGNSRTLVGDPPGACDQGPTERRPRRWEAGVDASPHAPTPSPPAGPLRLPPKDGPARVSGPWSADLRRHETGTSCVPGRLGPRNWHQFLLGRREPRETGTSSRAEP